MGNADRQRSGATDCWGSDCERSEWNTDPKSLVDGKSDSYVMFYGDTEKRYTDWTWWGENRDSYSDDYMHSSYGSSNVTVMCADGGGKEIGTLDVTEDTDY